MAITLFQSCGFETADSTELRTATSIGYETTVVKTGDYSASVANGQGFTIGPFDGTGRDAGGIHCITFHWRCTSVGTNGWFQFLECYAADATGDVGMAVAYNDTTGNLEMYDEAGYSSTPVATTSWTPSTDTWYHIAVMWEPNVASGDYAVFIDGTEMVSGTTGDFLHATGTFDIYNFTGDNDAGTQYFDDVCVWTGLETTDDYLSSLYQPRIHRYRSTKASATPDGPASPTNLSTGTWAAIHGLSSTDTVNGDYPGGVSYGTVNTDDSGGSAGTGGPNTDTEVGDYIVCTKVITRAKRSGGGGTAQYVMAHGSQSTSSVTGGVTADSGTLDVSSQMTTGGGIRYSRDGTHLYVNDGLSGSGITYQYDLTTAWDLSTASYASKSLDASSYVTGFPSLEMSSDGKYVFIGDSGTDDIFTFTLSTAWDLSTGSWTRTWAGTVLDGIAFSEDGLESVTTNNGTAPLRQTYTTAWDTSTATSTSTGVTTPDNALVAIQWSENGRYLLSKTGGVIHVYHCTRAFDVRSMQATPIGVNPFDPYTDATSVGAACFGKDGEKLVVLESTPSSSGNGLVKQYTLSTPYSAWNTDASFKSTSMTVSADLNLDTAMTNYETYSETVFPRTNEYLAIGFEKDGGGQDYDVAWQVGQVISVLDPPVTSTPRTVTQDREGAGDLTTITMAASATVTLPDFSRTVTCTTEVLNVTSTGTVTKNVGRELTAPTVVKKNWKGLSSQVLAFDGANNSGGHANVANMLDSNTGTSVTPGSTFTWGRGFSGGVGPVDNINEKVIRVDIRVYTGGNGDIDVYAGYDDTNMLWTATTKGMTQIANDLQVAGAWSDWFTLPVGNHNWDDPHNDDFEALSWSEIKENLSVGVRYSGGTSGGTVHAIEVKIWSGESVIQSGYFDGNLDTTNTASQWTNEANIYDGSTTTWASHDAANTSHYGIKGNTLTQGTSTDEIYGVYVRARARFRWNAAEEVGLWLTVSNPNSSTGQTNNIDAHGPTGMQAITCTNEGSAVRQFEIDTSNSAFWTPWYSLDFNDTSADGHINWTSIPQLWANVARPVSGDAGAGLDVAKVEIVVISAPPNDKRRGGRAKKNRGALADTQLMAVTANAATVDRGRGVNQDDTQPGDLSTLAFTENAATISFQNNLFVTCTTEAIALDGTNYPATINASRVATGLTEALAWDGTTYPATVSFATHLNVTCSTSLMAFDGTTYPANVAANRGVISASEAITMPATGNANLGRNKVSGTEAITMPATGNVNLGRNKASETEAISFAESLSTITRDRVATGLSEIIAWDGTTYPATISTTTNLDITAFTSVMEITSINTNVNERRVVAGSVELTTLAGTASTVNAERGVGAATEVLALADNDSTVTRDRVFTTPTEAISFADNDSTTDRQRGVNAGTEAILFTESLATITLGEHLDVICSTEAITMAASSSINRTLEIAATTEVVTLAESAAVANTSRNALGVTEAVVMTESAATIDTSASSTPRDVTCTTEALSFTENASTILFSRSVPCNSEIIISTTPQASLNLERGVLSSTEALALTEQVATINASRVTSGVTEALVFTEAAAIVSTTTDRIVTGLTSLMTLAENAAATNSSRAVSSASEQLSMTSDSSVARVRNVTGLTEIVTMTSAAALNRTRGVAGTSEELTFTELAASVFRGANLDITANIAVMALTEQPATVAFPRVVTGSTETILFAETVAILNRPKLITCATEQLVLTEGLAKVTKSRTGAMPGYAVYVYPDAKPVWVSS